MANSICRWKCPDRWSEWSEWLAAGLHARNHWRLPVLLVGILFAQGRRTVTSWLRAAGVSDDFRDYYYFLAPLGRKSKSVATRLWVQDRVCDLFWPCFPEEGWFTTCDMGGGQDGRLEEARRL